MIGKMLNKIKGNLMEEKAIQETPQVSEEAKPEFTNENKVEAGKITKTATIGQVVKDFPVAVEILEKKGVHCVGCQASYWETIEEGLKGHGFSDEQVDAVIQEINKVSLEKTSQKDDSIDLSISDAAADKIKQLTKAEDQQGKGLRVNVVKGGCSGYMYEFKLEAEPKAEEKTIEHQGTQVFIDQESLDMLKGSQVDYVDTLQGAGFKVVNPNAKSTCGCGESFR